MSQSLSPKQELDMLLQEKGTTCVSIIVPLPRWTTNQQTRKTHVEKAMQAACDELINNNIINTSIPDSVNSFLEGMSFSLNTEGVGIFVSENVKLSTAFPFIVTEKIVVSNVFELREILFKLQCTFPYNVLYMDENLVRLFTGNLNQMHEIQNKAFPFQFSDSENYSSFFYSDNSSSSNDIQVKHDEVQIKKFRPDSFYQEIDGLISPYIEAVDTLIVFGDKRLTSAFINRTRHFMKISSVINGHSNYDDENFSNLIWPVIQAHIRGRMKDQIDTFKAKKAEGQTEEGITDVWEAVCVDRGLKLLVEKDFHQKGFTVNLNPYTIHVHRPKMPNVVVEDAVDEIISTMLKKEGQVFFVDNGMLSDHGRIVLLTI